MKCSKVKNACKICLTSVNKKTGLQCQGACQKWAHYKCLNYTPGKIQDIKTGIIQITCPCPDCDNIEPKEILADPPYTCTNTKCPANKEPICEATECPSRTGPMGPLGPNFAISNPIPFPPMRPSSPKSSSCPTQVPCPKASPTRQPKPQRGLTMTFSPKQSRSCTNLICPGKQPTRRTSSEPKLSNLDQRIIITTLENLCTTVTQLSTQLRDLMCRMKEIRG